MDKLSGTLILNVLNGNLGIESTQKFPIKHIFDNKSKTKNGAGQGGKENDFLAIFDEEPIKIGEATFYHEDKLIELKQKLQLVTGIPIFKQHIQVKGLQASGDDVNDGDSANSQIYMLSVYGHEHSVLVEELADTEKRIGEIPVDMYLYNNSDGIQVSAYDYFRTIGDLLNKSIKRKEIELYLLNLDSIMANTAITEFQEHIYYGFVLKFYPMLTKDTFLEYITESSDLANYDRLHPNSNALVRKYEKESKLIKRPQLDIPIDTFVRSATMYVEGGCVVNLLQLFARLQTDDKTLLVSVKTRTLVLTKTKRIYQQNVRIRHNEMVILFRASPETIFLMRLYPTGRYKVETRWNALKLDYKVLYKLFEEAVNPFIRFINSLGRPCFVSYNRLKEINLETSTISSLHLDLFWRHGRYFADVDKELQKYVDAGIFNSSIEKDEEKKFKSTYYFSKGTKPEYQSLLSLGGDFNDYSYTSDPKMYQKWYKLIAGRQFVVNNRLSDMKIELDNVTEAEYELFVLFFKGLAGVLMKQPKVISSSKMRLKKLKEYDPVLFDLKMHGSKLLYSKLCQQKFQPLIFSQEEIEALPKAQKEKMVKYWNFTVEQPVYYLCDNPRIPYLHFRLNKHPLGFCLPCCKITPVEKTKRKMELFQACLERRNVEHINSKTQRYVIAYGKVMEPKRIGSLPSHFTKYFGLNFPGEEKDFYLLGVDQDISGVLAVYGYYLQKTAKEVLLDMFNYVTEHPDLFLYLHQSRLNTYFSNIQDFLSNLLELSPHKFGDWDKLLLELGEYTYDMVAIVFRDNRTGGEYDFELEISKPNFPEHRQKFVLIFHYVVYSPIVKANTNKYFSKGMIDTITYTRTDPIIQLMASLLVYKPMRAEINLKIIREVCDINKFKITRTLVNARRLIYAVVVETAIGQAYIPVALEPTQLSMTDFTLPKPLPFAALKNVIDAINKLIVDRYHSEFQEIAISTFLLDQTQKRAIGFYHNQNYYFDPIDLDDEESGIVLKHSPDVINSKIVDYLQKPSAIPTESDEYMRLFKEIHGYDLFILEFFQKLDQHKNDKVRASVVKMLKNKHTKELREKFGVDEANVIVKMYQSKNFDQLFKNARFSFDGKLIEEGFKKDESELVELIASVMPDASTQYCEMLAQDIKNPLKQRAIQFLPNIPLDLYVAEEENIYIKQI